MISFEDARLMINKWNQESLLVRCDVVVDGGLRFSLIGTIDSLEDTGFGIRAADMRCWARLPFISLHGYDYGDSRTAAPEMRDFVAENYEAILRFKMDFALISIAEIKQV